MPRIMRLPSPHMSSFERCSRPLCAGSIQPNIRPMRSFPTAGFSRFLMTLSPQKVKNIVTRFPVAAAPLAMTNEASALSRSSLKTTIVLLIGRRRGRAAGAGCAWPHGIAEGAGLRISARTLPPQLSRASSSAPVMRHHEATSWPKAWSVAAMRSCPPGCNPSHSSS